MSDYRQIAAVAAERFRALEIREIVYFHCDHFEPWSGQRRQRAAEQVVEFVDAVQQVDFARRLTLFYSNPWNTRLDDDGDLVRAAPEDTLGFVRRSDAEHEEMGAPFRYLRTHAEHELQIHIHHENFTWTRGMADPARAAYLRRPEARALDGLRLEAAVEQWLQSARREFGYAPSRWFFVHGLWSLNGSDPEGCNIHDEIARLMKWGCRGDFTFPAGRAHCDPHFEAPYFCAPATGPKSYDSEAACAEFAWGNRDAAADKFFIWNSPIKALSASLDWGNPDIRRMFAAPDNLARDIVEQSFRCDGVLFVKTHAHSMHPMNRGDGDRLVHPHCYGPVRDLYTAIFDAAAAAGAAVTFATAGDVYDRFVAAPPAASLPAISSFRPSLTGRVLPRLEPTGERVLDAAAELSELATAAIVARTDQLGVAESGAEAHYAELAKRGSVVLKHDIRAAQILLSQFGTRFTVQEIGAGIGVLPLLLAALGIAARGIESSQRRYDACVAVAAEVSRHWSGQLAPHDFVRGRFPECVEGEYLADKVAVLTDFTTAMSASERQALILALRAYGAVLLDADRFIRRGTSAEERRQLVDELRDLGFQSLYDADISSDFAFIMIVNDPRLLDESTQAASLLPEIAPVSPVGTATPRETDAPIEEVAQVEWEGPALVELNEFEPEAGHCFRARLPAGFPLGDTEAEPGRSRLVLFEDGFRLGPPHNAHAEIRASGSGRYSHWGDELYFSTRDNSDPRAGASRFHVYAGSPRRLLIEELAQPGSERELRIVLAPPFEREIDLCWRCHLVEIAEAAALVRMADREETPRSSVAQLYEDGVPLGPAHTAHATIREAGGGGFSHWNDSLYFSTSDNSDPNSNGRRYEIGIRYQILVQPPRSAST